MVSGKTVDITGKTIKGVFYGAISLIHLALKTSPAGSIPHCEIIDWPRFPYRGQHVDTGRNFFSKETILKLLEVMSLYKLNKLHFHLSDDEGWRLEIPGLEELTTISSRRCHDPEERECVMSTLGSGAGVDNSGTGYYTLGDYKDILHYANTRQIEVIPEFGMPGHAHAAIVAMKNRERKMADIGNMTQSKLYNLHDEQDYSIYSTNQGYTDNAINPCIESTYRFIQHIFTEVKELHRNIQPLQVFHFGGDEVAKGAWQNSTACAPFLKEGINLKREFTRRVSEITREVNLGAWEDGLIEHDLIPWNRSLLLNHEVITQSYQNVLEWGTAALPYNLANAGYKVVLAPLTHIFFDHPQEPSPEESGINWGTRYTDAFKTFSFMPDDYYKNIDMKRSGEPITMKEVCNDDNSGCPPLKRSENIIGLQGQLWSEIIRTQEQFDYMLYPRILALAERSWHRASWEGHENITSNKDMKLDWSRFARSLGSADLVILDKLNVSYRIPSPGARQSGDKVLSKVEFPGLKVQYRTTSESSWSELDDSKSFKNVSEVTLRTLSADGKRISSEVKVTMVKTPVPANSKAETIMSNSCMLLLALCCTLLLCKSLF
ncbi:beta-hexosaminidase [Biomphalaria pfeifferi]|uniref:beta-N-acetylhexosaminidase n=1 Tax=Biomphalaria pfeifferi TaxID=112525 RepID=A0AAD8BUQ6_BIOPF|nr:beta-hexosaminidase [Biomphalaria pfeifferi]